MEFDLTKPPPAQNEIDAELASLQREEITVKNQIENFGMLLISIPIVLAVGFLYLWISGTIYDIYYVPNAPNFLYAIILVSFIGYTAYFLFVIRLAVNGEYIDSDTGFKCAIAPIACNFLGLAGHPVGFSLSILLLYMFGYGTNHINKLSQCPLKGELRRAIDNLMPNNQYHPSYFRDMNEINNIGSPIVSHYLDQIEIQNRFLTKAEVLELHNIVYAQRPATPQSNSSSGNQRRAQYSIMDYIENLESNADETDRAFIQELKNYVNAAEREPISSLNSTQSNNSNHLIADKKRRKIILD